MTNIHRDNDNDAAEWSDMGRDLHYPSGWCIIPFGVAAGIMLGAGVVIFLGVL